MTSDSSQELQPSFASELFKNLLAGLTVSFVAISLGAAFGIMSERGAFAGIISAGVIALITALFGGTRIQCSGPTAPMTAVTVLLVTFATTRLSRTIPGADPDQFISMVFLLSGAVLVLTAVLRLGRFIEVVPKPVISGFMDGIAILIWLDQFYKLFGLRGKTPIGGDFTSNLTVVIVTAVLAFVLPKVFSRFLPKWLHFLPAALVTIIAVTIVVQLIGLPVETVKLDTSLNSISDFTELVQRNIPRQWSFDLISLGAPFVLQLVMLCYLDTLLTSLVVDKKMREDFGRDERTKQDKELAAQGFANGAVALLGGIPGAQATIRSVLILNEGATWRLAGVAVGIFVIIEMLLFQDYISLIPQAVFTGILIKVGYDVFDRVPVVLYLWQLRTKASGGTTPGPRISHESMLFIAGTALVTVVVNLNVAVISFCVLYYLKRVRVATPPARVFYRAVVAVAIFMTGGWVFYGLERTILNVVLEEAHNDGSPLTYHEIDAARRTWPEEENGARVVEPLLQRAATLGDDEQLNELPLIGDGPALPLGRRWTSAQQRAVAEQLKRFSSELATIDRLVHYTGGCFVTRLAEDNGGESFNPEPVYQLVRLKSLQTVDRVMRDDTSFVVDDIMVMTVLSRLLVDEPSLTCAAVGDRCDEQIMLTLQHVCAQTLLDSRQLFQIYHQLAELEEHDNDRMYWAFLRERAHFVDAYDLFTTSGFAALRGWYLRNEARGLRLYNGIIRAARKPAEMLRVADSLEEQFHREMNKLDKHYPDSAIVEHSLHRPFALHVRTIGKVRCARTALAVERYRIDNGRFPAKLDDLLPGYLDTLLMDPFDGEPLRYRVDDEQAVIYAIGENMTDDGGKVQLTGVEEALDDGFVLLAADRRGLSSDE